MKKSILIIFFALCSASFAQEKLAQTGFQFLSVGLGGRATGMGEAFTTVEGVSTALFYNPAGLARMTKFIDLAINWNNWIADIKYNSLSCAVSPRNGLFGTFGISALWVDYGEFLGTMVWNNSNGYIDTETFTPRAMSLGFGYAKSLTDKFSVGGQIKYVVQSSGRNVLPDVASSSGLTVAKSVLSTLAYDFGTIYQTGFKSLAFGMSVRNFSEEIKYAQEGFQLPLTFRIGIAMDVLDLWESTSKRSSLLVALEAVHPRSHGEYLNLGLEYELMDMFAIRLGYVTHQDEYGLTYGVGIQKFGLGFDYAYTPFGVFEDVQKLTMHFSM